MKNILSTQDGGSAFGKAASSYGNSAGGGGFYGGYGGTDYIGVNTGAGSGGSGYIGNSLLKEKARYCYSCEESSKENPKTISTTCSEESATSNCSKQGNGYAKITLISAD